MKTKETVKHTILYISIALILITTAFTASRAFYLAKINVTDTINPSTVTNANLEIEFLTSRYINEPKMMLINDADRQNSTAYTNFTITSKSTSTMTANYTLYLTDFTISTNFISEDFKWELTKKGDSGETTIATGNFSNAVSGKDYTLTTDEITISPSETQQYVFRIWLSYADRDQSNLLEGSFSGKIGLTTGKITKQ